MPQTSNEKNAETQFGNANTQFENAQKNQVAYKYKRTLLWIFKGMALHTCNFLI